MKDLELMDVLNKRNSLQKRLDSLVYGSIEIRNNNTNKYIYVHYRDKGRLQSKYIGEYNEDLYNLILKNNIEAKKIKNEISKYNKQLKELNYEDSTIDSKIKLNIDFAKRNMVSTIYKQAILEGVATTYADTESIIEGGKINNMTSTDIMKIVNLKHAWEFILDENVILSPSNFYLLSEINKLIEEGFYYNAGKVRSTPISIGGTSWIPPLPVESQIIEELNEILNKKISNIDICIELLLYIMKRQIFIDGNKRTAVVFANHYLISKGLGIIVIPENLIDEYKKLLILYYEGKNKKDIVKFLKDNCYIKI